MQKADVHESAAEGFPCIELYADSRAYVENHIGVIEFGESIVRLKTALGILRFEGAGLRIRNAEPKCMLIDGQIASITFEKGDQRHRGEQRSSLCGNFSPDMLK